MSVAQNLEQLLAPIAGDNPAGIYLKGDRSAYRPLRNSYNVAQTSFRKLTNNPADEELEELELSNQASWKELSRLLMDVVAGQSKDLECISWLTLAQLFTPRPYRDLAASLKLMAGVVSQYGEQVQPGCRITNCEPRMMLGAELKEPACNYVRSCKCLVNRKRAACLGCP